MSSETKNGCPSEEKKTPNDKQDTGAELKKPEVVSNEAAKQSPRDEEYDAKGLDSGELRSENRDIDTKQDSVAESNILDSSVTGIERDVIGDVTRSSHTSNANDTQCKGVERPAGVDDGDTLLGKRKVFSADITHFLDETNGDLLPSDSAKGAQQSQKQDSWSEIVIVGSGKDSPSAKESDNLLCQSQVNGLKADRTDADIETRKTQRKLKANVQVSSRDMEALNQKTHFLNSNDDDDSNLETNDRQSGETKISEVEIFSGDQSGKSGKILKTGNAATASFAKASTSRDVDKDHGDRPHQLSTGIVAPTAKSALPLPLTPPPDGGTSRRQRGGRGGQTAPVASKQTRGAGGQSGLSGRRRWSPLEDKTVAENVELDASSQQVSWTSNRATTTTSSSNSPWTDGDGVTPEESTVPDPARKVEFDDNFVVDAAAMKGFDGEVSSSTSSTPERRSQPPGVTRRSSGGVPAKDIGSLVQAPPECVLERKPLISENEEEEEEDEDDDDDGHLFADHQRSKRTEEEKEETTVKVATVQDLSISKAEEDKKLVHIDEVKRTDPCCNLLCGGYCYWWYRPIVQQ